MRKKITNSYKIFDYIKPLNNDYFHKIHGLDLLELLYYLNNYYLEFRDTLDISKNLTFGLELEFE